MRHQAKNLAFVFVKRNSQDFSIIVDGLCEHIENMPCNNLVDILMRFGTSRRGQRS